MFLSIPAFDAVAGLIVAGMIGKAGYDVGRDSLVSLIDGNVDADIINSLRSSIAGVPDVLGYHKLRARRSGPVLLVDLHIEVDPRLSISATHQICDQVEAAIRRENDRVAEVIVHADPVEEGGASAADHQPENFSDHHHRMMPSKAHPGTPGWLQEPRSSPDHYPTMAFSVKEIESQCKRIIENEFRGCFRRVSLFTLHYVAGQAAIEISLVPINSSMTVMEAIEMAEQLQATLRAFFGQDISKFDIHLDLNERH